MNLHSEKARWAALLTDVLLIAGLCAWCGWFAGLVLSLPLLAILQGLWKKNLYRAKWGSLVLVFYTSLLLAEAYAIRSRHWVAIGLSSIAAIEFVALNLYVRFNARERLAGIGP
jgi:uncharacterized membrane protein